MSRIRHLQVSTSANVFVLAYRFSGGLSNCIEMTYPSDGFSPFEKTVFIFLKTFKNIFHSS